MSHGSLVINPHHHPTPPIYYCSLKTILRLFCPNHYPYLYLYSDIYQNLSLLLQSVLYFQAVIFSLDFMVTSCFRLCFRLSLCPLEKDLQCLLILVILSLILFTFKLIFIMFVPVSVFIVISDLISNFMLITMSTSILFFIFSLKLLSIFP